jgi:integration host factor subunit alpha
MPGKNIGHSTMTKADLVNKVYEKIGFSKREASDLVEMTFSTLKELLMKGQKVKVSSFGIFSVRAKAERKGRNPQTGEEIRISARKVLNFRPSDVLKAQINGEKFDHLKEEDDL